MEEEMSVEVEETTGESQPEVNTEEAEAPEAEAEESSEETGNTAEAEPEAPKRTSRASERIRELVAQKKELEARLQKQTPQLEGVDETGIDPERFAQSVERRATQTADEAARAALEYYKAETEFPLVKDNTMVRSRASVLVDEGYTPTQAAEIATIEWNETTGNQSARRKEASAKMRQTTQIPSAGKAVQSSDTFTRAEIAKMSSSEYVKNASAIQAQLEKYGPESFE